MNDEKPELVAARDRIIARIEACLDERDPPILVALDGPSGSGKSTLAEMLEAELDAALVQSDDFFAADIPDAAWDTRTVAERLRDCIDWRRLRREALEPLLAGETARWHPFDFVSGLRPDGTYGMQEEPVTREPAPIILVDGAYSARPALGDLIDLAVLVDAPPEVRQARQAAREEAAFLATWHRRWDPVEARYFTEVRPPSSFDLVVTTDA